MSKSNETPGWMKAEARRSQSAQPGLPYAQALREVREREGLATQASGAPVGVTQDVRKRTDLALGLVSPLDIRAKARVWVEESVEAILNERDPMRRWQKMSRVVAGAEPVEDAYGFPRALLSADGLMLECAVDVLIEMDHPTLGPWESRRTESNPLRAVISGECAPLICEFGGKHASWFGWATCEVCAPPVPVSLLDDSEGVPVGFASFDQQDEAAEDPGAQPEALAWLAAEADDDWLPLLVSNESMPAEVLTWVAARKPGDARIREALAEAKQAPLWLATWLLEDGDPVIRSGPDDRPETLRADLQRLVSSLPPETPMDSHEVDSPEWERYRLKEILDYRGETLGSEQETP